MAREELLNYWNEQKGRKKSEKNFFSTFRQLIDETFFFAFYPSLIPLLFSTSVFVNKLILYLCARVVLFVWVFLSKFMFLCVCVHVCKIFQPSIHLFHWYPSNPTTTNHGLPSQVFFFFVEGYGEHNLAHIINEEKEEKV